MAAAIPTSVANPDGVRISDLLHSFERWLFLRIEEARAADGDLAFRDRPLDHLPGRDPELVGWEHMILASGAPPPAGESWTVYRLNGMASPQAVVMGGVFWAEVEPLLQVLGYQFDPGRPADAAQPGERRRSPSVLERLRELERQIEDQGDPSGLRHRLRLILLSEIEVLGILGRRREDAILGRIAARELRQFDLNAHPQAKTRSGHPSAR